MEEADVVIVGAGIVGLAVSYILSDFGREITVIEKNPSFGHEASSRNSEVIHAGIYYPKQSLKAETCIRGKELLYALCTANNIPHKKLGKLIVAHDKTSLSRLEGLYENARDCGVRNLRFLGREEIKRVEKDIEAESAIFSPDTGILDSHALMRFLFQKAKARGVNFAFSVEVTGIEKKKSIYRITVEEPQGDSFSFKSKVVINAAGLYSDKISALVGIEPRRYNYCINYSKGQYFRVRNPKKFSIRHLVYPPPQKTDLGIHITPDLAGGLRLGPDAKYVNKIDYAVNERDKEKFCDSLSKFLPAIRTEDLIPDTAGIRAKLQKENEEFRDFVIRNEKEKGFPYFVNLIGIESPGLTACLAIAERVMLCLDIR